MTRGNNCGETILSLSCLAVTLTAGVILQEEKMPCPVAERQFWRHFRRQFGRGQLRVENCRETVGSQLLPRDIKVSRRALWKENEAHKLLLGTQ